MKMGVASRVRSRQPAVMRFLPTILVIFALSCGPTSGADAVARPNILWITSEDHGPHLGCYGDRAATTPHVDALAARGLRYRQVWSNAPVCAPARTTLISGLHATSAGAEQMRSLVAYPAGQRMFPQFLADAGYYCSNNSKEDYNLASPGKVWDESSGKAHWKNRPAGAPFFAVFNSTKSHESRLHGRGAPAHDPEKMRVPAYHPDTPEVRRDWAVYYDGVTAVDAAAGQRLKELEDAGLVEDTIVFYFADHGAGMPRSKRWPGNSGLQVPLVVHIPEKFKALRPPEYRAGGTSERLVSFVDFAPTVLCLAGVKAPAWMQGRAFLGESLPEAPAVLHGFRGRMDERTDLIRSVTDGRYVYLRNYLPHLVSGQHLDYQWKTPTTRVWQRLHLEGKLNAVQAAFWQPKPPEELYDLQTDPDEVRNLAASPDHAAIKARLRQAQQEHAAQIRDVGFIPEGERLARSRSSSPYDYGHGDEYAFARIFATAELASLLDPAALPALRKALADPDSVVRHWAVLGLFMRGPTAVAEARADLQAALKDPSPNVAVPAAQALAQFGPEADFSAALDLLVARADWSKNDLFTALAALDALDALGSKAAPCAAALKALPGKGPSPHSRYSSYVPRLLDDLRSRFP